MSGSPDGKAPLARERLDHSLLGDQEAGGEAGQGGMSHNDDGVDEDEDEGKGRD